MALHSLPRVIQDVLRAALPAVMIFVTGQPAAAEDEHPSRVRSNGDSLIASLLREGYERSVTFRHLVETIDGTDGLVYLQRGACGHGVQACLSLSVVVSGPSRMLRVVVDPSRDRRRLIAAIGHELQHAVEALSDPHVTDYHSMYSMFDRIGPTGLERFETKSALNAGLAVDTELASEDRKTAAAPRVRDNGDPAVAMLLRDAQEHSVTFRRLLETIGATDGVVYVEQGKCRPGMRACLLMTVTASGPNRILKVHVDIARDRAEVIGSIGHELQHAIEVLKERGIRTDGQMYQFFDRLAGSPASRLGQLEFETEEAVSVGLNVRAEFSASAKSR